MRYHACHDPYCRGKASDHPCHVRGCFDNRVGVRRLRGNLGQRPVLWLAPEKRRELAVWRKRVSEMPSAFGRLTYLASLRSPTTGRYQDYGLGSVLGEEEVHKAVWASHQEALSEWLAFDLKSQSADLDLFLSSVPGHRRQILAACAALAPPVWLIPEGASEPERELFLADLDAILELLYAEYGITAVAEPEAARHLSSIATRNSSAYWPGASIPNMRVRGPARQS